MTSRPSTITQNADVRFLGKLLGDVIRAHGGQALFERIEAIRAASVDRYRGIANPRGLGAGLETLSLDETVAFVRSFMLFSMLANLAEDRQGAAAEEGNTLASALKFLSAQGIENRLGWWVAPEFTLSYLAAALFLLACHAYARNRPGAFVN